MIMIIVIKHYCTNNDNNHTINTNDNKNDATRSELWGLSSEESNTVYKGMGPQRRSGAVDVLL